MGVGGEGGGEFGCIEVGEEGEGVAIRTLIVILSLGLLTETLD